MEIPRARRCSWGAGWPTSSWWSRRPPAAL